MSETTNQPDPEPTPDPEPESTEPARYAVYDVTHKRFVGPVHDTKAKATKASKADGLNKSHKYEVRKV